MVVSARPARAAAPLSNPAIESRKVAFEILSAVIDRNRSLDEAIDSALRGVDLPARDRAFARTLATTALRRLGQIHDALGRLTSSGWPVRPPAIAHILTLGAAQLLFLETPPHAAVATSVDLASRLGNDKGKGLVNAVLRRLAREGAAILAEQDAPRLNTPDWLWRRWSNSYGAELARSIAVRHMTEPPLDLTLKQTDEADRWAPLLDATLLPTGTLRRAVGGRIEDMPGFAEGAWWIQDVSAALPARLFGDQRGRTVLDLCAAPGGKTAQLAAGGASVRAVDRSAPRLKLVDANLARLGLTAETIAADALAWSPAEPVDAILLDAPCSATGTIRRHPDIALSKKPEDIDRLRALQTALLQRAAGWLRPGGMLVYCTCSLEPEEGEEQARRFLAAHPTFTRRPIVPDEIAGLDRLINAEGDLRTLPCHLADQGGMDGFFATRLVRQS